MKKFLACSGLSVLLVSLLSFPARSGDAPVSSQDSSNISGDTFGPNRPTIGGVTIAIKGATVTQKGNIILVVIPRGQINALLGRLQTAPRLQIAKYSKNDLATLRLLAANASLAEVLQQAISTLQQIDPARAARIQGLLTKLQQVLAAISTSRSSVPSTSSVLVAANLEAISGELREAPTVQLAQANGETSTSATPNITYDPPIAGAVVDAVEENNKAVQSLSESDAKALTANTSFNVAADILEQIAGELRGKPVPDEKLAPITQIIASVSK